MNNLINIYKLLSDETRLRLMVLLYQEKLCVCQLSGILDVPQPRVSKYLSKLRDLQLVIDERNEKFVYYKLNKDNEILNLNLSYILENISDYPEIENDQKNITNKHNYKSVSKTN